MCRETGLTAVEETALEIPMAFRSFDDYCLPLLGGAGPADATVARLAREQRDALREALQKKQPGGTCTGPM